MPGLFISASRSDTHVGQALHDGAERAGEGRVADLEALDGEVDPIDQAAFVEGVLVGQFQFDVPDQEFQFGALLFVQRRLLLQLLAQGG